MLEHGIFTWSNLLEWLRGWNRRVTIWYDRHASEFNLMIVVSLMTEEPDAETQKMVDDIRIPKGKTILGAEH